jgi:GDP-4-dehydro-6-deoxy-D-mannose reductase
MRRRARRARSASGTIGVKRALITGAAGMVGSHLVETLAARGEEFIATYFDATIDIDEIRDLCELRELDVRDAPAVEALFEAEKPEIVYHLAAQSFPTVSWRRPLHTMEVNAGGTINIFESICSVRARNPSYDPVVVVACSSAEYGASLTADKLPIAEDALLLPLHPYGVSKVAQDLLAFQYWVGREVRCIRARIFNTTGPRKQGDVISDWAARVARIVKDGHGELVTGNQESRRAILDVNDLVRALLLLAERGSPGEAYNISGRVPHRVGDFISAFEQLIGLKIASRVDPSLLRPTDEPIIIGDVSKLERATGWRQRASLHETLKAVLDYELARLADANR